MSDKYLLAYCVDMNGRGRISSAFETFGTFDEAKARKSEVRDEHGEYIVQIYIAVIVG